MCAAAGKNRQTGGTQGHTPKIARQHRCEGWYAPTAHKIKIIKFLSIKINYSEIVRNLPRQPSFGFRTP
jgi:hypothetical protein